MPHLIVIGAVVAGGVLAWKAVKREMARVERKLETARQRPTATLRHDPATGRYRLPDQ